MGLAGSFQKQGLGDHAGFAANANFVCSDNEVAIGKRSCLQTPVTTTGGFFRFSMF